MTEKDPANIIPSSMYNQMGKALRDIEAHYAKSTQAYVEELGHYTLEIKRLTTQIEAQKREEQKNLASLRPIEDEIYYHERQLDRLNEVFCQKIIHLEEMDESYAEVLDNTAKKAVHEKHTKELTHLLTEIEEFETILLEQELQRLNLLSILEPIQHKIVQLYAQRKECMLNKEHYETTKMPQIALFSAPSKEEDLVDIDVIAENIE